MIFSNRFGFLYIHIAKTGGTSIKTALKRLRRRDPLSYPQLLAYNISKLTDHRVGAKPPRHARAVCAKDLIARVDFVRFYKFAFVRNPWDHQVSAYHHMLREFSGFLEKKEIQDFPTFLRWNLDRTRPIDYPPRSLDPLSEPFLNSLCDVDGSLLVDFIGAFERLEEDWIFIQERLGLDPKPLPRKRISERSRDYREQYDDELREMVANHFAREIDVFGYSFDGGPPEGALIGEQT